MRPFPPGSLEHDVLTILATTDRLTTVNVQRLLDPTHRHIEWSVVRDALLRLGGRHLAKQDDHYRWSLTPAGKAALNAKPDTTLPVIEMPKAPRPRSWCGTGDARPLVLRPGALNALELPTRMGRELRWRDGRRQAFE